MRRKPEQRWAPASQRQPGERVEGHPVGDRVAVGLVEQLRQVATGPQHRVAVVVDEWLGSDERKYGRLRGLGGHAVHVRTPLSPVIFVIAAVKVARFH